MLGGRQSTREVLKSTPQGRLQVLQPGSHANMHMCVVRTAICAILQTGRWRQSLISYVMPGLRYIMVHYSSPSSDVFSAAFEVKSIDIDSQLIDPMSSLTCAYTTAAQMSAEGTDTCLRVSNHIALWC